MAKSVSAIAIALILVSAGVGAGASYPWTCPNHYRAMLAVDPRGVSRSDSPATISGINFASLLTGLGATGTFDRDTIEVVAYDTSGQPRVFDSSRSGYEKYLLPCRLDSYFGTNKADLGFVMPDSACAQYAVYFDTIESGLGKPVRYKGIVGDGDFFSEGFKRREVTAGHMDDSCDFDGDGDMDCFRVTTEPFIYCYENVGGNRMVYRGKMSSGGSPFIMSRATNNRSWPVLEFNDWENDGDTDLFPSFTVGPDTGHVVRYENITTPGGELTMRRVTDANDGRLVTVTGKALGNGWFGGMTIVDFDGDGNKDVTSAPNDILMLNRNIGSGAGISNIQLADGVPILAGGQQISGACMRAEFADLDHDTDLDMFITGWDGNIYFYRNTGTRTSPVYAAGQIVAVSTRAQVGVTPFDWDGDGEIELAVGQYWPYATSAGPNGEVDGQFGDLWKNIGTPVSPNFVALDAYHGCPYTEQFQPCAVGHQNGVKACDWNNDGKQDFIAGDQWGLVYHFRNNGNQLFPIFDSPSFVIAGGQEIDLDQYTRVEVCDWDEDGDKDMLVSDGYTYLWLYRNTGTNDAPVLAAGQRLSYRQTDGTFVLIDGSGDHSSVMVCDWNHDDRKDVILGDSTGLYVYHNVGTDAAPILGPPTLITTRPGQTPINYIRPNLGAFVDWNGDGMPDFIACQFEDCLWYYRNRGPWTVGTNPDLAAGVVILQPWTQTQMIQGAQAIDWNGDGDLDILTGQGHGGTGFRLYERDYMNDWLNNTYPVVTALSSERGCDVIEAKLTGNGSSVIVPRGVVTFTSPDFFYVQTERGMAGIRVQKTAHGKAVGDRVDVSGALAANSDGERYIAAGTITPNGTGSVSPVALGNGSFGGSNFLWNAQTGAGQVGADGAVGLNTIGLLVRVYGKCGLNLTGGDYYGRKCLFIDDGSGKQSWYRGADGAYHQVSGIRIDADDPSIAQSDFVNALGVCSLELVNGFQQARLLPRNLLKL